MSVVLILGLVMNAVALPIAGRRVWWLYRLMRSGQPAPGRVDGLRHRLGAAVKTQLIEVFGQRKLLKWTVPGLAHFFVFWAFVILASVYLEAYGALFDPDFAIPLVGHWPVLGFLQDFIAVMAFLGIATFAIIRIKNSPRKLGRWSRFSGSHLTGAWLVLFMIFNVLWSMFVFRGAAVNTGHFPYRSGAFVTEGVARLLEPLSERTTEVLEHVGLLVHIGVMLSFLILVVYSKHLHIFLAPLNVLFKRQPVALGALLPMMSNGKPLDFEEASPDTDVFGRGKVEDFTWKGFLDFATCTECGRCQDQCPAWNTEKPLSPKMVILELRDHAFAKAPYILADDDKRESLPAEVKAQAERPLVGTEEENGVIHPDVLWSCVTCGACVNQCPVDIEHVDHILDMRRYQVLVESNFPAELNQLFKGMESKGNPWNLSPTARMEWAKDLPFEVKVVGEDVQSLDEVEWLFWVGCAGAYEDRAKKTTRAVAELLDLAGVSFAVLGNGETCTGDSARRAGNEFIFQGLAQQNAETFKEYGATKVVTTCAHCFNTLKNEYGEFGVELEAVHHTQLLNRLVREGKLTPVADGVGAQKRSITYHDPCYIGRHNGVYSPPRELLEVLPGAEYREMERHSERSFCCGAGGARMWMEENIGTRINENRTREAVGTGADQIAVGCPFCRVMLSDGLTAAQSKGEAREEVEVLDVAQLLLASVKGVPATRSAAASAAASGGTATVTRPVEVESQPEPGDVTATPQTVTATADAGPAAKASGGSSLFDTPFGDQEPATTAPDKSIQEREQAGKPAGSGGSLFDLDETTPAEPGSPPAEPGEAQPDEPRPAPVERAATESHVDVGSGASLFDIAAPDAAEPGKPQPPPAEPVEEQITGAEPQRPRPPSSASRPRTDAEIDEGGSLFDL